MNSNLLSLIWYINIISMNIIGCDPIQYTSSSSIIPLRWTSSNDTYCNISLLYTAYTSIDNTKLYISSEKTPKWNNAYNTYKYSINTHKLSQYESVINIIQQHIITKKSSKHQTINTLCHNHHQSIINTLSHLFSRSIVSIAIYIIFLYHVSHQIRSCQPSPPNSSKSIIYYIIYTLLIQNTVAITQTLTTNDENLYKNGAKIHNLSPAHVQITSDQKWQVEVANNTDNWGLWLNTNKTWGFHTVYPSVFTLTLYGSTNTTNDCDLILSIADGDNSIYFTWSINLFDSYWVNKIAPACYNSTYPQSTDVFMTGNVYSVMSEQPPREIRQCRAAYIDNFNYCEYDSIGQSVGSNGWPLKFTITNYPIAGYSIVTFGGTQQYIASSCGFGQAMPTDIGLNAYITAASAGQIFYISSIDMEYSILSPTNSPSTDPTTSPSKSPIINTANPTTIAPSIQPSQSPITSNSTTSKSPTINPSKRAEILMNITLNNNSSIGVDDVTQTVDGIVHEYFIKASAEYNLDYDIIKKTDKNTTFVINIVFDNIDAANINSIELQNKTQNALDKTYGEGTIIVVNVIIVDNTTHKTEGNDDNEDDNIMMIVIICITCSMTIICVSCLCLFYIYKRNKQRDHNKVDRIGPIGEADGNGDDKHVAMSKIMPQKQQCKVEAVNIYDTRNSQ